MSFLTWILKKFVVPIPKIDAFDEYLFIGPHPDDIEVGAGATVSRLVEMGKKVTYLIATDGCYGSQTADYNKAELIKTRQEESLAAAKVIGVNDVRFLPFSDCGIYDQNEITHAIAKKYGGDKKGTRHKRVPKTKPFIRFFQHNNGCECCLNNGIRLLFLSIFLHQTLWSGNYCKAL